VGFVYISPQIFQRIQPVFVGWAGVENQWDLLNTNQKWAKNTQRFETGTFNSIGIIGALRSLKLFLELGIPNIQRRILELTDFTLTKVQRKGYPLATSLSKEHRSGIVTFFYPKDTALHSFLLERGIIVTARNNTIRVSPHIYSDEEDVEFLMTAVDEFECKR